MPPQASSSKPPAAHPSLPPFLLTTPSPTTPPSLARLQALYASTSSQRLSNPTGYTANATWWADVIQECLRSGWICGKSGDRLVLKVDDEFVGKFDWDGKRPKGLGGVIERDSTTTPPKLHPLSTFLASPKPIHAPASAVRRFVGRPLYWVFSQLNPFGGEREVKEEDLWKAYGRGKEYVHVPLVEAAAARFTAHVEDNPPLHYTDSIYDVDTFRRAFGRVCIPDSPTSVQGSKLDLNTWNPEDQEDQDGGSLSKRDVTVLIKWLMRDMGVVVTDGTVVKVLQGDETVSEHPISEVDRGVVSVLNALEKVEAQIASVEKQITKCQAKAKTHLAASQKPLAMSQLRSKRALEEILVRRVGVSEQLRAVVRSIDEAQNDVDVMKAYETSTSSLRTLLSNPQLSADHIERTTEDLAETLASQREVDDAIRIGGAVAVGAGAAEDIDEDELARELEGLVEEEKEKKEREEKAAARVRAVKEEQRRRDEEKRKVESASAAGAGAATPQSTESKGDRTQIPSAPASVKTASTAEDEWEKRYDAAQVREKEERARADAERLKREEKRVLEVSQ